MNFGDILDAWDQQTRGGQKKTGPGDKSPLADWLSSHEIHDKDAAGESPAEQAGARRKRLLAKKPDDSIDLHGLTRDEARTGLETFFVKAREKGYEKLLIIHGKGNHSAGDAVLKDVVRRYLEQCPFAGENGRGSAAQGGSGATWVLLKSAPGGT